MASSLAPFDLGDWHIYDPFVMNDRQDLSSLFERCITNVMCVLSILVCGVIFPFFDS